MAAVPPLKLLSSFAGLFSGKVYNHRDPTQGDGVVLQLYEDLLELQKSTLLGLRIEAGTHVVNTAQRVHGKKKSRRGDGTFGDRVPTEAAVSVPGFRVQRGLTATLQIGAECKIISAAQGRQVGRVISDLHGQANAFRALNANAIRVAIIGVNRADRYSSVEGAKKPRAEWRVTTTTGRGKLLHPAQEAASTIATLRSEVGSHFDELVFLEYLATNQDPFPFAWVNERDCRNVYSAALTRIATEYSRRFPS